MKCHILPPESSPSGGTAFIGWNRELSTFFIVHVTPPLRATAAVTVAARGFTPCEIPTIAALHAVLARYGVKLPEQVTRRLRQDMTDEGAAFGGGCTASFLPEAAIPLGS